MAKTSHYNGDSFYANTQTIDFYLDIWNDDMNLSTIGDISIEIGSKYSLDIFSEGSSVENDINTQFWGKIEYSRSGGIHIPLPFLRDLNLNNTVSFSFNTDFESSIKLVGYQQIESRSELTLNDSSSKLSFSPKMSYQFSQWVSGNIFFKYILYYNVI